MAGSKCFCVGVWQEVEDAVAGSTAVGTEEDRPRPPCRGACLSKNRILNFKNGIQEIEQNVTNTPTSYTPENNIITAINYTDGILFYTDGRNEPKRIVTDKFKFPGGNYDIHARVDMHSFFRYRVPISGSIRIFLFEEDQITVIRKT